MMKVIPATLEGRSVTCDIEEEVWNNLQEAGCTPQEADFLMEKFAKMSKYGKW
jgi:hypothetical protein